MQNERRRRKFCCFRAQLKDFVLQNERRRRKKEVVENKKEVVERFLETKSKSWKVVNRGKPPRILKINKKANRGTALKGGQLCANSLVPQVAA